MESYDVAVLGAGPGGYAAALRAAQRGARVCCIERRLVGGTCLNVGCIATKAMLHGSRMLWDFRHAGEFGISASDARIDAATYTQRVAKTVASLRKGVEGLLKARKVDVVRGCGRLTSADTLAVETDADERKIKASSIIIATGSRPAYPAFLPIGDERIVTTDQATTAGDLPESVLILGGGVIGCEFATIYSELGIPTTIVEMLDNLLPGMDADAGRAVARSLKERNVRIITGAKVTGVISGETGVITELEGGETINSACLLAAVGRKPNIDGIGLESAGVEQSDGIITVDDRCRTNIGNIYAVGDVAEARQYAHLATRMGLVAADNATGNDASDDRRVVPECVYTHPEVATVGLAETATREKTDEIRTARFPYLAGGMAHACGQTQGMVKLTAAADGQILGATVIGPHATDVIAEVALAMRHGLTVSQVAETIHAHPTFAEAVGEAAEAWCGLPLHTLR